MTVNLNFRKSILIIFLEKLKFLLLVGKNLHFIQNDQNFTLNCNGGHFEFRENLIEPVEGYEKSILISYKHF